jgi:hypothetical protein
VLEVGADDVTNWDKCGSGDNVTVYKKMTDGSPVVLLKAYTVIEGIHPDIICEVMSNAQLRKTWDKVLSNFDIIEEFPEEVRYLIH